MVRPSPIAISMPDPCPVEAAQLLRRLDADLPPEQVARVRRAYEIGAAAHQGQTRKTGEPYITHPIAVATLLN